MNTEIKALINADAAVLALVQAGRDAEAAAALNASDNTDSKVDAYRLTAREIMDILGPVRGTEVMASLRANGDYAEVVRLMDGDGVNLSHKDASAMLDGIVTATAITRAEAYTAKALPRVLSKPEADAAIGRKLTANDISAAWADERTDGRI